ncbi:MAG TPA: DUF1893 domain-containing protein [Dehalococcoidales bacterium]|nr:DUF1893 domain-containing protein [Dehalococcoidales bacterium]
MHGSKLLEEFAASRDTLWVYQGTKLIFKSRRKRLSPLLDYIKAFVPQTEGVIIYDRIVGNAAALLLKKALCLTVYSLVASQAAVQSMEKFGISHHFSSIVNHIQVGDDVCPMEKLAEGKSPDEFYQAVKASVSRAKAK